MKDKTVDINEVLFMAFVGLYIHEPDGNFVSLDDKYNVLKDSLKKDLLQAIEGAKPKNKEYELKNFQSFPEFRYTEGYNQALANYKANLERLFK